MRHERVRSVIALSLCALLVASCAVIDPLPDIPEDRLTLHVTLPAGAATVDVYRPFGTGRAPMVIIAHGFSRSRHNMSGWGRHLAGAGIMAVVPDLPAWSDHVRNGAFLSELQAYLLDHTDWREHIDPDRVGLMGFSAGGLASLLAAADAPDLNIWVGLDPVDRATLGATAAGRMQARAVVITAEASACNAYGNARDIVAALPAPEHVHIAGAVHGDAEWPGSRLADLACERTSPEGRAAFREQATAALKAAFAAVAEARESTEAER